MFSIAVAPFYNPINNACKGFQLFHILTNTCYCAGLFVCLFVYSNHSSEYEVLSHCVCVYVCEIEIKCQGKASLNWWI